VAKGLVAVVKTEPGRVLEDCAKVMELAGLREALIPAATTILKDNISWHYPMLSANTTPWQLEGAIRGLKAAGFDKLAAVHNNTVVTDPYKGGRLNRLTPIYQRYSVPERFNFLPDMEWLVFRPKGRMLALDRIYPEGIRIPEYFIGKNILHLPTVKCHIYTTTTGAMKNAFGGLLSTRRHYTHSVIHETLVDLLRIQQEIHSGIFCLMDGTICGCGPGPRTMLPVEKDYLLASADSVAIDAVAAKLMGFDPMSIRYIRLADDAGLGVGRPERIEIVGEDVSGEDWRFWVGRNFAARFGHALWFSPLKVFQRLLFHTPLVYAFVFGSYVYHDYVWWPLKGKAVQREVRRGRWGRLFESYPEEFDVEAGEEGDATGQGARQAAHSRKA